MLCSVVPRASRVVRKHFGASLLEVSPRCDLGFSLQGYPKPETIGADRLANLAGATRLPDQAAAGGGRCRHRHDL